MTGKPPEELQLAYLGAGGRLGGSVEVTNLIGNIDGQCFLFSFFFMLDHVGS